jgi:hypothetical protein
MEMEEKTVVRKQNQQNVLPLEDRLARIGGRCLSQRLLRHRDGSSSILSRLEESSRIRYPAVLRETAYGNKKDTRGSLSRSRWVSAGLSYSRINNQASRQRPANVIEEIASAIALIAIFIVA